MKPLFIMIHGSYGSPESNWFPILKEKLERLGQEVIVPRFPVDNWESVKKESLKKQTLANWLDIANSFMPKLRNRQVIIVGHSLGPLFALHLIAKYKIEVVCLIAVCPFLDLDDQKVPEQISWSNKTFYDKSLDYEQIRAGINTSYVLYSENDPFVPKEKALGFAEAIKAAVILVRGAGHMSDDVNMKAFPLVLELCKTCIPYSKN